jgi:hypothetical protein
MLAEDKVSVDAKMWTDAHVRLLKRAASYPTVERIFVHPAICDTAAAPFAGCIQSPSSLWIGAGQRNGSPLTLKSTSRCRPAFNS